MRPINILIADDNLDVLRIYSKTLLLAMGDKHPLSLEEAGSVTVAIEKLRSIPFDIIVVDLKMPGLTENEFGGLDIIAESQKSAPHRPIVVITGYGTIELVRKTHALGAVDFIEKTVNTSTVLLSTIQNTIRVLEEQSIRVGNPFTHKSGLEPTIFGGRVPELKFFEEQLFAATKNAYCDHFLVLGNWGMGKSTLLTEYRKICQNRGYIVSLVPLEPVNASTSLQDVALSLAQNIIRNLSISERRLTRVKDYLQSIGVTLFGFGINVSRDITHKDISPSALLHDTLQKLWEDLKDESEVIVILLDDLDNYFAVPDIITTLKQTLSMTSISRTKIIFGIACPTRSWLELTMQSRHNPIARYFLTRIELKPLLREEIETIITQSTRGTGVNFSPEVIECIYNHCSGQPFEFQVLCHFLFKNQNSRRVGVDIWDKALQETLFHMGHAVFNQWYEQLDIDEVGVLKVIGSSADSLTAAAIKDIAPIDGFSRDVQNITKGLIGKGLIVRNNQGSYKFEDNLFREYIRFRCRS